MTKNVDIQYLQVNHVKYTYKVHNISRVNVYIFHVFVMDILNIHTFCHLQTLYISYT